VDDLRAEVARLERECDAWERHGQEETFARERLERDKNIVIDNRNSQMLALTSRLSEKETALQLVMDAVSLAEAKGIAREAIRVV
jgi:hypothetical protein